MRILSGLCIFFLSTFSMANDGVYTTSGSNIYPIKESHIKILSEQLSFKVRDQRTDVFVKFKFLNPASETRRLKVGFQAPSSSGDVNDAICNTPQISGFKTQLENEFIAYNLYAAECETCELKDTSQIYFAQSNPGVFVYLFDIEFKPGVTEVSHSYSFPASSGNLVEEIYNYILTTGSKWAGGTIGDFELSIDMGENAYFYVSDIFGDSAEWSIIGTGKVTDLYATELGYGSPQRMVRTVDGFLRIKSSDFNPQSNLEFGVLRRSGFSSWGTDKGSSSFEVRSVLLTYPDNPSVLDNDKLTPEDLRIIRNTIYAQKGYLFKNKELREYFSEFQWYMPDPNLKQESIEFSSTEIELLERIKIKERTF